MPSISSIARENGAKSSSKLALPKVALVDDDEDLHLFFKDLGGLGHFQLIASFTNGAQALERLPRIRPDLVFMDIRLPDMSGIESTKKLKTILPALAVIILTGYPDGSTFFRSLMAGAKGFLAKPVSAQEVLSAISDVLKGEIVLAKPVIPYLVEFVHQFRRLANQTSLPQREEQILAYIFQGLQDKEIASALGIGTATVHTHMYRLFKKLGVHSRAEIIAKYLGACQLPGQSGG